MKIIIIRGGMKDIKHNNSWEKRERERESRIFSWKVSAAAINEFPTPFRSLFIRRERDNSKKKKRKLHKEQE